MQIMSEKADDQLDRGGRSALRRGEHAANIHIRSCAEKMSSVIPARPAGVRTWEYLAAFQALNSPTTAAACSFKGTNA